MPIPAAEAVDALYRSDWGRIVATLIRLVGDFDLAEEVAQEAFAAAVDQWPTAGVPEFPRAWIIQTARHKALDRLRRRDALRREARSLRRFTAPIACSMSRSISPPIFPTIGFASSSRAVTRRSRPKRRWR